MLSRVLQFINGESPPPVFADLVADINGSIARADVQTKVEDYQPLLNHANRIGLALRHEKQPRFWLQVNGTRPRYFSRVIGRVEANGGKHERTRVACIESGELRVWLHQSGLVEIGSEPMLREC